MCRRTEKESWIYGRAPTPYIFRRGFKARQSSICKISKTQYHFEVVKIIDQGLIFNLLLVLVLLGTVSPEMVISRKISLIEPSVFNMYSQDFLGCLSFLFVSLPDRCHYYRHTAYCCLGAHIIQDCYGNVH